MEKLFDFRMEDTRIPKRAFTVGPKLQDNNEDRLKDGGEKLWFRKSPRHPPFEYSLGENKLKLTRNYFLIFQSSCEIVCD
jgi:hypothetical protein